MPYERAPRSVIPNEVLETRRAEKRKALGPMPVHPGLPARDSGPVMGTQAMAPTTEGALGPLEDRRRILIVESDERSAKLLHRMLLPVGNEIQSVATGAGSLVALAGSAFDLVVIGTGTSDMTYTEVLRRIRETTDAPVIAVANEYDADQLARSLEDGADDYIARPFRAIEFGARVQAALRRSERSKGRTRSADVYADDAISIDFRVNAVRTPRGQATLRPSERRLLRQLVANEGCVVTHAELALRLWGIAYPGAVANLHVLVSQLRRKVEPDPARPQYLLTHRGIGYAFIPAKHRHSPPPSIPSGVPGAPIPTRYAA